MLPEPRVFVPVGQDPEDAALHALAASALAAPTGDEAARRDAELRAGLVRYLDGDGNALARLVATAPSVDAHRYLVRALAGAIRDATPPGEALAVVPFAIPVVLVAGLASAGGDAKAVLDGSIPDAAALAGILRDHGALQGNRTIVLAPVLAGASALDPGALPAFLRAIRLPASGGPHAAVGVVPSPLAITGGVEAAHLRFLVGTALAAPGADLLRDAGVGRWGMPLAQALSAQLASPGVSLLALPRPAQPLPTALDAGRAAQREASAQLFASNALRRLRAGFGEPTAVLSAHRLAGGAGELRLSLSTPFDPREAEGFRAPLLPGDRVADVEAMLRDLLADCRVNDVREVGGVHPDRDPATGMTLLFKPDTIPPAAALH